MVLVAGPRLDMAGVPTGPHLDVRPFVPISSAITRPPTSPSCRAGLTTTMELAAFQTPFLYFPLRNHFEQSFHVARRLDRLGAGVRMDFDRTSAEELARPSWSISTSPSSIATRRRAGPSGPRVSSHNCCNREGDHP
jgi:hypothetical protein